MNLLVRFLNNTFHTVTPQINCIRCSAVSLHKRTRLASNITHTSLWIADRKMDFIYQNHCAIFPIDKSTNKIPNGQKHGAMQTIRLSIGLWIWNAIESNWLAPENFLKYLSICCVCLCVAIKWLHLSKFGLRWKPKYCS